MVNPFFELFERFDQIDPEMDACYDDDWVWT